MDSRISDERIYEAARQVYLNTEHMGVRHIVEKLMVEMLRRGVKPCYASKGYWRREA